MSKLAKSLKAFATNNVVASRKHKMKYVDANMSVRDMSDDRLREFRFEVRLGVSKVYAPYFDSNVDISKEIRKDLTQAIVQEIFGEFRPILSEMRIALYNEDSTRMRELIAELEYQMFVEDGIEE
jgi:hypothetical protein